MMENNYKVICIDDQELDVDSKDLFNEYRIELHQYKNQKDGLDEYEKNPGYYDAIILDVVILNESDNETPDKKNFMKARDRIIGNFRDVPCFIWSSDSDVLKNEVYTDLPNTPLYKRGDCKKIIEDITEKIQDNPNRKIKNKYPDLFDGQSKEMTGKILEVLRILDSENCSRESSVLNQVRRIIECILPMLYEKLAIGQEPNGSNITACSSSLSDDAPVYIQRCFHSLSVITNDGSHNIVCVKDVESGVAPYLVQSTIYEMANLLKWANTLPDAELPASSEKYENEVMILQKDKEGNYHCGDCLLDKSSVENLLGKTPKQMRVGGKVKINGININTKGYRYKYYTEKVMTIEKRQLSK